MWMQRAALVLLVSLSAFAPDARAAESSPQDAMHQVIPGDDLHLIAGYYYGDARQWPRIWEANRDQVRNPNRIEKGQLLRIPDVTPPAEPYPDFVARARAAVARALGPGKAEATPPPELEVRISGESPSGPATAPGAQEGEAGPAAPPPTAQPTAPPTALPPPPPPPAPRP
jgi:hypothetical protein